MTFSFAILGLLVKCIKRMTRNKKTIRQLTRHDQWLHPPSHNVIVEGYQYDMKSHKIRKSFFKIDDKGGEDIQDAIHDQEKDVDG